eukprot:gene1318-1439_t
MSKSIKLSAKWQLDAALLSRPVDLTALVSLSKTSPDEFLEDGILHRLVSVLLNEQNDKKSDKDTKLDVLNILANVAAGSKKAVAEVRAALHGVSEWFDEYMTKEEAIGGQEPELNKAMILLLARCWNYRLKTEDVLELTKGNRKIALCTVVGLLEDGETYSTTLKQKQKPGQGKMGQWEHELICHRYEKPLLLQICRLLQGFTHPGTYFDSSREIALYSVEKFSGEMDTLLEITLRSKLVEKLSMALYDCLFDDSNSNNRENEEKNDGALEEHEHIAVTAVHAFLQNLYFYGVRNMEEYRRHLLMETLLIPRFVLPYLDRCVIHATILNTRAEAYSNMLEGDCVAEMALHNPNLVKGIASSLRTLIIASFRAPSTQFVMTLLRRLNPTTQLLRAAAFCRYHDYIFALICILNVNMGSLDISRSSSDSDDNYAELLMNQLASVYTSMDVAKQSRVTKRLFFSGALPIARDTSSYASMISILNGGLASQLKYVATGTRPEFAQTMKSDVDDVEFENSRVEAKRAHMERMSHLRMNDEREKQDHPSDDLARSDPKSNVSAFRIAVSVANAAEHKGVSSDANEDDKWARDPQMKYRLLGDLPELGVPKPNPGAALRQGDRDEEVALSLVLHTNQSESKSEEKSEVPNKLHNSSKIPQEFLCSINGHVMKDPVRVKSTGLVFERATIELWLATRGAVCPITNTFLDKSQLEPDEELRNRIKRYQIQQITSAVASPDDDLYDF